MKSAVVDEGQERGQPRGNPACGRTIQTAQEEFKRRETLWGSRGPADSPTSEKRGLHHQQPKRMTERGARVVNSIAGKESSKQSGDFRHQNPRKALVKAEILRLKQRAHQRSLAQLDEMGSETILSDIQREAMLEKQRRETAKPPGKGYVKKKRKQKKRYVPTIGVRVHHSQGTPHWGKGEISANSTGVSSAETSERFNNSKKEHPPPPREQTETHTSESGRIHNQVKGKIKILV